MAKLFFLSCFSHALRVIGTNNGGIRLSKLLQFVIIWPEKVLGSQNFCVVLELIAWWVFSAAACSCKFLDWYRRLLFTSFNIFHFNIGSYILIIISRAHIRRVHTSSSPEMLISCGTRNTHPLARTIIIVLLI